MSGTGSAGGADAVAVVVAAGRSSRLPGDTPKQYRPIAGRSVLERAVASVVAHPAVASVVVVLPASDVDAGPGRAACGWPGVRDVIAGGATRAESVRNGVAAAGDAPFVLVHDGARPSPSFALVDRVVRAMREHGAAVPGLALTDTIKSVDGTGRVERTLDRARLAAAQTPQGFRSDWLRAAIASGSGSDASPTDEAAALEAAGYAVHVVAGEPGNRKVTTPEDLRLLRLELEGVDVRVGTGFDIHRTLAGRRMVLGGVEFEGELGLDGHSDADVVLHAAMDAVLGATAMGDIGEHFPPDDAAFENISSVVLARRVAAMLADGGWSIVNIDLTLLAERPRIRERAEAMRESIAEAFAIGVDRVGLKATTLERLGALGRGDGVACQASALVRRVDREPDA